MLNTTVAESFRQFADVLEKAEDFDAAVAKLIKDTLTAHGRIIFNGNGYGEEWKKEAARRGLTELKTSVDAYRAFTAKKNIALFSAHGVMTEVEIRSRAEILFENYAKLIHIEAEAMNEIAMREILPAVSAHTAELAGGVVAKAAAVPGADVGMEKELIERLSSLTGKAFAAVKDLHAADAAAVKQPTSEQKAAAFAAEVLPRMQALRALVDEMETMTPASRWPMPNYGDMMFRI